MDYIPSQFRQISSRGLAVGACGPRQVEVRYHKERLYDFTTKTSYYRFNDPAIKTIFNNVRNNQNRYHSSILWGLIDIDTKLEY